MYIYINKQKYICIYLLRKLIYIWYNTNIERKCISTSYSIYILFSLITYIIVTNHLFHSSIYSICTFSSFIGLIWFFFSAFNEFKLDTQKSEYLPAEHCVRISYNTKFGSKKSYPLKHAKTVHITLFTIGEIFIIFSIFSDICYFLQNIWKIKLAF